MRILLVDDDPGTLNALRVFMASAGHEIITANDGQDALDCIRNTAPDSVTVDFMLTDLKMPGMNGLELIRELKKERPRLPMILMTAYGSSHVRAELSAFDLCGYFEKPVDPERLLNKINMLSEVCGFPDGKEERHSCRP